MIKKVKKDNPILLADVKEHIIMDKDYVIDDYYLSTLVKVSTTYLENEIENDVLLTTTTLTLRNINNSFIEIREGNFISVDSIIYNGVDIINDVIVDEHDATFIITFPYTISSEIEIIYKTGFASIPEPLVHVIKIFTNDLYNNRGDMSGIPVHKLDRIKTLIRSYKKEYWR